MRISTSTEPESNIITWCPVRFMEVDVLKLAFNQHHHSLGSWLDACRQHKARRLVLHKYERIFFLQLTPDNLKHSDDFRWAWCVWENTDLRILKKLCESFEYGPNLDKMPYTFTFFTGYIIGRRLEFLEEGFHEHDLVKVYILTRIVNPQQLMHFVHTDQSHHNTYLFGCLFFEYKLCCVADKYRCQFENRGHVRVHIFDQLRLNRHVFLNIVHLVCFD